MTIKNLKLVAVLLIGGALCSIPILGRAQDLPSSRVPSVVTNAFQQRFPKAVDIDWELEHGIYQADFEINRLDHEVWFDREGRMLKHKQEIKTRSLPEKIRSAVRMRHRGYRLMDAEKLTRDGRTVYKLELRKLLHEIDIIVDDNGEEVVGFLW